jgi:hypothetical protein
LFTWPECRSTAALRLYRFISKQLCISRMNCRVLPPSVPACPPDDINPISRGRTLTIQVPRWGHVVQGIYRADGRLPIIPIASKLRMR